MKGERPVWDVLVVGAGPTGIAVGAEARRAGLSALLIDKGPVTSSLLDFPTFMSFFTTRDRLEIANVPFSVPDDKPDRRQALVYYRAVVRHYDLTVRTHEEVIAAERTEDGFTVQTRRRDGEQRHRARAVVVATGYFGQPRRLGVPGEDQDWVRVRYREPFEHFGEHVALIGAGNSACEAALELWRNGVEVTLIHRRAEIKPTVKYWVKPDMENRIAEGAIEVHFDTAVEAFEDREILATRNGESVRIAVDAAYVLIGYSIDAKLLRRCGIEVSEGDLIPSFDEATGESNVPGFYVAGAVRSGVHTNRIFIDNSREHGKAIVAHIAARLGT
ncbi:MAG: YpdA family putative bacillithiol disulfide reductase [Acidobacteria bacterium]|nr:YpdA family putative bacillithiol disulfide reductase [Acidobacteriota bacterium]